MKIKNASLLSRTRLGGLTVLLLLLGVSLQAQTEKGKLLVSASTSNISFASRQGNSSTNLGLSAGIGHFVANNLAVGGQLGFGYNTANSPIGERYRSSIISVGAFGRYYIPLTQRIKIPIDMDFGMTFWATKSGSGKSDASALQGSASSGLSYFLSPNASIDLLLGYTGLQQLNTSSSNTYSGRMLGSIGFSLYLDCKNKGE
jgi:Outer membrane protein beta-barrel domain